ncbi:Nn.00g055010.m01.CDS01 [Neocucurbitaria sp. VM-36]
MNDSSSHDISESSLPVDIVPTIRSSPPIIQYESSSPAMEKNLANKSEPPFHHNAGASRPSLRRVSSEETERPPSAQQLDRDGDEQVDSNSSDDLEEEENDPADKIVDFDWNDLHERYHEAVNKCHGHETELMQEWESLMTFFRIWAESGHGHETGRTYARLRTRMAYVQHSEANLEQTRSHYVNVVRAFESALNLLRANGFGG